MNIRYLIGVDGGGSGTRVRIASAGGQLLGVGDAGPSALGQGIAQAWRHVQQAVSQAFAAAGLPAVPLQDSVIALGLAGAHVGARCDEFLGTAPGYARVLLHDDGMTSLWGAHRGAPGAVIAAGTGSIGEALHADGRRSTVGGWGFGIGDEGSGAWLGLRAIRVAHRAQDGRAAAGPLARAVWAATGESREALLAWGERATQATYAQLAPLVFDAEATDPAAAALLAEAVAALERHADALDPAAQLPLAIMGSVGLRLRPRFASTYQRRLVEPAGDAVDGALWIARRALEGGPAC